eukprot:Rhum_TRINITY_DN15385_c6_g2::Rhum_TRINITY_DN15385_c6_g2_i4::g.154871::m.154871
MNLNANKRQRTSERTLEGQRRLVVLVHLLDLRAGTGVGARGGTGRRGAAALLVHLRHDRGAHTLELLLPRLVLLLGGLLGSVQPADGLLARVVDLLLVVLADERRRLLLVHRVLHRVGVVLQAVLRLHTLLRQLVRLGVLLGVLAHGVDLRLRQTALVVRDRHLGLLARRLVLGRHVHDAVGVNVERHLNLRHATRGRRDARQVERTQLVAVLRHGTLTLEHLDVHTRLVVRVGREDLALLRRDRRVPLDQRRHHASGRLDTARQRRHVEEQDLLRLLRLSARQHERLHGRAERNSLVGVDRLVQLLSAEEVRHHALHLRDTRGAAHQHNLVDRALVHLGVRQHLLHRAQARAEQVRAQLLETRTRQRRVEVDAVEQGVDLNARLRRRRQGPLGALARRPQPAQGTLVRRQVLLVLPLELLHEVVHHAVVEVLTTQVSVSGRRLHLEDSAVDRQQRHIERTATQVEDQDVLLRLLRLVQAVRDGRSRRLVDDTQDLHAGDRTRVLRRLTLRVVEVRRHRHHGLLDLLAQERL